MENNNSILIVIRGNSSTGKTTLANQIEEYLIEHGHPTLNLGWDKFIHFFSLSKDITHEDIVRTTEEMCHYADDYIRRELVKYIILEGVFLTHDEKSCILKLSRKFLHSYFFKLECSLGVLLMRNENRERSSFLPTNRIRYLFHLSEWKHNFPNELTINTEFLAIEAATERILRHILVNH